MRPIERAAGLTLEGGEAAISGGGREGRALRLIQRKSKEVRQKVAEASPCDGQWSYLLRQAGVGMRV